jgi:hypothetical protein
VNGAVVNHPQFLRRGRRDRLDPQRGLAFDSDVWTGRSNSGTNGKTKSLQHDRETHLPSFGVEVTSSLELVQEVAIRIRLVPCPEVLQVTTVTAVVLVIPNEDIDGVEF